MGLSQAREEDFYDRTHDRLGYIFGAFHSMERIQKKIGRLIFLVLTFACFSPAHAEVKDLNLVYISGYHALPLERLPEVLAIANHYFNEVGISFRIKLLTEADPCPLFHSLPMRIQEMRCFSKDARANGFTRHRRLTYYMTPPYGVIDKPIQEGGVPYFQIAGMTEWIGGKVAIGNAEETNQDGLDRITESGVILAHESLHMLGARHNDSTINLMHPNALAYVHQGEWLPVLRNTVRQIRRK